MLARAIGRDAAAADIGAVGRQHDDGAAVLNLHLTADVLEHSQAAVEVDLEVDVELLIGRVDYLLMDALVAGAGQAHVNAAEVVDNGVHGGLNIGFLGDVADIALHGLCALELGDERVELCLTGGGDCKRAALVCECLCRGSAGVARGGNDEYDLIFELEIHSWGALSAVLILCWLGVLAVVNCIEKAFGGTA